MALPDGMDAGECRSCKAPIYWVTTASGKKMPVDRGAEQKVLMRDGVAHVERVFQSHFVSCPDAARHRRS
jgi:hypothetical protein